VEQNVEQALKHSNKAYIMETGKVVKSALSKDLLQDTGIREAYLGL
jgi:branched-chain amino acid transport system ATP-binding protein